MAGLLGLPPRFVLALLAFVDVEEKPSGWEMFPGFEGDFHCPLAPTHVGCHDRARFSERTKDAIARMARHYARSPDLLRPQEIEAYMLHLVEDRHLSYISVGWTLWSAARSA